MPIDIVSGIVQILGYNDFIVGTGFIVSNSGLIATCAHVIQEAEVDSTGKLTIRFQKSGSKGSASVVRKWWSSPDNKDIAILQLEHEVPEGVQVLPLGTSKGTDNHEVESFGFPSAETINGLWDEGTAYKRVTDKRGNTLLQIDSSVITAGFSGSPLLDKSKQRVIGMIVSIAKEDPYSRLRDTAFAIPIETLQSICPTLKIEDICPYRGLLSFTEEDQEFFFGRDELIQDLMNQLRSNPRFLALVGSSGSGKSSVISGGLLPRIRQGDILGFENSQIVTFRPGIDPNQSLKREVDLFISPGKFDLWDGIRLYLQKEPDKRLVIFADQFEELFTISTQNERNRFIEDLISLLESGLKVSLILTIRADFYSFLLESEFGKYLSTGQINVRSMSKEEIEQAIEKPTEAIGLQIETGLTKLIITDLKDTKDPLPLLEFTLTKLWERRSDALLTYDSYHKLGGVTGAIGQWAGETYGGFTDKEKELARRIFTRLIYYGERGTPDSRRRLPLDELAESEDRKIIHKLITKLADVRLLVTDREDRELSTGIETVEIVHDSLLTEWGQLKEWIKEHHTYLLWRQGLETRINEWKIKKDEGSLLRGASLVEAIDWNDKRKKELNQSEKDYIRSSLELKEKEQELKEKKQLAENQRKKKTIRYLSIFSIVILFLAVFATYEWNQTYKQKQLAEEKTKEARLLYLNSQSSILGESAVDLDTSILLAIESFRIRRTSDADRIIRQSLSLIPHNIIVMKNNNSVDYVAFSPNGKYIATASYFDKARFWDISTGKEVSVIKQDTVSNFAFSPDGKYIAAACTNNTTRLWDISTGKEVSVMKYNRSTNDFAFSPDGKYIVAVSDNNIVQFDVSTGKEVRVMKYNRSMWNIAFSPDGKYIATMSDNNTVILWNISSGKEVTVMKHDNAVKKFVFSPDGKYIATVSDNHTVILWNISSGKEVTVMKHDDSTNDVAFSPDGKYIATASTDHTARLWDVSTGKEVRVMKHDDYVHTVAFSPDGKYIATASEDKTARLWDVSTGKEVTVMKHDDRVNDVAFSPDGKHIATASEDKTARLWDAFTDEEINLKNVDLLRSKVFSFSPDGKYIAVACTNNTTRLWDISTGKQIFVLNHDGPARSVVFSPDGKYIATISGDNAMRLWDISTGKEVRVMKHDDSTNDVAFSPDGKYIATISDDNAMRLWDISTGKEVRVMKHYDWVNDVAFSPDGKYIATASDDHTVRLWDVSTGKEVSVMRHGTAVVNIVFSPDGKYIATASWSSVDNTSWDISWDVKTVQLWDVSTGKGVSVIKQDKVNNFAFSPDGKYIATAGEDKTARLWDVSTGKEVSVMEHNGKVSNVIFSPDGRYIATVSDAILPYNKNVRTYGTYSHQKYMQTVNRDSTIHLWDLSTGKEISAVQHEDIVNNVTFSPDGKYIATASDDKTARLWDALTGEEITVMKFDRKVDDVAFSPDGKCIALDSEDNTIRLWEWNTEDLISEASTRLTRNLTPQEWKKYMGDEPYHKTFPNLP